MNRFKTRKTDMRHFCRRLLCMALTVALAALPQTLVQAEDIDLFVGGTPASLANPNVLFIIDNSANWSEASQNWVPSGKQGQSELRALKAVIGSLGSNINIGLMMLTAGTGGGAHDGAYIRYAMRPMTDTNKAALIELIGDEACVDGPNSLNGTPNCILKNFANVSASLNESVGSNVDYSATLFEAFKYFGGFTDPANANTDIGGTPLDASHFGPYRYSGNPGGREDPYAYYPLVMGASTATNRNTYLPPISSANNCAKNFIIFIGNGFPAQDAPSTLLSGIQGDTTQLSMPVLTTVTTNVTANIGFSCGTHAQNAQRLADCTRNIPQALKDANPANSYACIDPGVADTGLCGTNPNSRKYTVQSTRLVNTVTDTGTFATPKSGLRFADEWAKYLFTTDVNGAPADNIGSNTGAAGRQNVTTYAIDVFKDHQDPDQTALLFNMARVAGGKYFQATSEAAVQLAIETALIEIQATNTVFAAASLPISATNRTQNQNQVFFGLFRPDGSAQPRWYGNLKQYQVARSTGGLILADASGNDALSASSGFFQHCAASFWTTDTGTYWTFAPSSAGQCTTASTSVFSDLPDGPLVEKGGAAEVVRRGNDPASPTTAVNRIMKTCTSTTSCSSLVDFNTTNVSISALGAADAAQQTKIVDYTLGQDIGGDGADVNASGSTTDTRPSIHGDVVHSRPLPVDHGDSTGVVVYYGGNDGPFRAVRTSDGKELWSFIAPEHHAKLKRLWNNSPVISYPPAAAGSLPKDYFFDGTPGVFQSLDNTQVWIFPTMRRGGRMIYGFNVSNPALPALMWRQGCPGDLSSDAGCSSGFDEIGQTWSKPNVALIKRDSDTTPVIVVGGGYDSCEDTDSSSPSCSSAKGRKVYVINAETGALIKSFDTERSVPADIALVDRDFNGYVDHAYVADTGGNLYRIDFVEPSAPATARAVVDWTITKIAYTTGAGRKFQFPPAVAPGRTGVILTLGSGDRERPLVGNYPYTTSVANRFYMFIDKFPTSGGAVNLDTSTGISDVTDPANPCTGSLGWRMNLPDRGEQVVTSSLITAGRVFFNTSRALPAAAGTCTADLGEAKGYNANLLCGADRFSVVYQGGGLPITPVQGTTTLASGEVVTFVIGGPVTKDTTGLFAPGQPKPVVSPKRSRIYWYRHGDK